MDEQKVAIIGLGYVGLPLAVEFGKRREVLDFDINVNGAHMAELQSGKSGMLGRSPGERTHARYLCYSTSIEDLRSCTVFTVTMPTPVDQTNRPDMPLQQQHACVGAILAA